MSPGSGPIDHSGHASLMSALLSALSVGGREPPLRSCRFEAVYCRNREDMSTPNYPLRPMRSTDSPSVRPSVSTWIFRGPYSAFRDIRCPFNLHCARRILDYLRCLVSGCIPARGGGGGSIGRLPPEAVGPWRGSLSRPVDRCQFRIQLRITLGLHRAVTLSRGSVGRQAVADLTTPL